MHTSNVSTSWERTKFILNTIGCVSGCKRSNFQERRQIQIDHKKLIMQLVLDLVQPIGTCTDS